MVVVVVAVPAGAGEAIQIVVVVVAEVGVVVTKMGRTSIMNLDTIQETTTTPGEGEVGLVVHPCTTVTEEDLMEVTSLQMLNWVQALSFMSDVPRIDFILRVPVLSEKNLNYDTLNCYKDTNLILPCGGYAYIMNYRWLHTIYIGKWL